MSLGIYRPWVLVIESTLPNTAVESFEEWEHGVSAAGYSFACFDGLNRFYVADEHADLAGRLALPPNVHDKFVTYGQYLDRMTVVQTIAERDSARALSEAIQIRLELVAAQLHNARLRAAEATQTADEAKQTADEAVRASEAIAASNRELSLELQAIVGSRSWRVTAPLRRTLGRG